MRMSEPEILRSFIHWPNSSTYSPFFTTWPDWTLTLLVLSTDHFQTICVWPQCSSIHLWPMWPYWPSMRSWFFGISTFVCGRTWASSTTNSSLRFLQWPISFWGAICLWLPWCRRIFTRSILGSVMGKILQVLMIKFSLYPLLPDWFLFSVFFLGFSTASFMPKSSKWKSKAFNRYQTFQVEIRQIPLGWRYVVYNYQNMQSFK